jgi:L-alanine-DL-glutamate epimerase-like enolase superfamily enzyme
MRIAARRLAWKLSAPFSIARETIDEVPVVGVEIDDDAGHRGRGEAVGVDYAGETTESMLRQIETVRDRVTSADGAMRARLLDWLPAGGARNALDAALWDLEAKSTGVSVWQRAGIAKPTQLTTAVTIGLDEPAIVQERARQYRHHALIKLKADAERHLEPVALVRRAAPSARLIVDANGSWTIALLERLAPRLAELGVELIEQPLAPGDDDVLAGRTFAVPLAADESVTDRGSLMSITDRYRYVSIKLDKTGGLTEALATADAAGRAGIGLMVGNMCGSSLAMAPATVIAARCSYVDLDGPLLQIGDVGHALRYRDGVMSLPEPALWG